MAEFELSAILVVTNTTRSPRIARTSFSSSSSPLTSETDTPCSPSTSALMPVSLRAWPFTVNSVKA